MLNSNSSDLIDFLRTESFTDLVKLGLVKFAYGGLVIGSNQFSILSQLLKKDGYF